MSGRERGGVGWREEGFLGVWGGKGLGDLGRAGTVWERGMVRDWRTRSVCMWCGLRGIRRVKITLFRSLSLVKFHVIVSYKQFLLCTPSNVIRYLARNVGPEIQTLFPHASR